MWSFDKEQSVIAAQNTVSMFLLSNDQHVKTQHYHSDDG